MKTKVIITDYFNGQILAAWQQGSVIQSAVFDDMEHLNGYFIGILWQPVFIDRREAAQL